MEITRLHMLPCVSIHIIHFPLPANTECSMCAGVPGAHHIANLFALLKLHLLAQVIQSALLFHLHNHNDY